MPSSGAFGPAITARSAARAAARACRSVTSRKAFSRGSFASIRASSSFTSSTGESRFAAISRPASAMVRNGGADPHRPRWPDLRPAGLAMRAAWPSALALALAFPSGRHAGRCLGLARRSAAARRDRLGRQAGGGRRNAKAMSSRAGGRAAWRRSARRPAARRARGRQPGRDSAPAQRGRAEAASPQG